MKQVRALTISSDANSEGFMRNIRKLVPALRTCLRNNSTCTVVKETCITIAFLSVRVGSKFDVFAATLLPLLLELLPSVSRLTATAAGLCITIIMQVSRVLG
ncbi:hypothetical protein LSAT2_012582 [Lamellibrachia satsuma]|nr:hypothetical protein LSAT2_012582 [Lamellibrachia satsuma]